MSSVFHCDGLLLCVTKDNKRWLMVWNPYLGQRRWINPIYNSSNIQGRKNYITNDLYTLGYDNNHNHKIFRILVYTTLLLVFEIYDSNSSSWRALDLTLDGNMWFGVCHAASLNGNTYFLPGKIEIEAFLLCFDYTSEKFGPRLPLLFYEYSNENDIVTLSCVKDEQLAMLHQHYVSQMAEIWITTKIEPNNISWSKFLKVDMTPSVFDGFPKNFEDAGDFFIDKEKKVLVVFSAYGYKPMEIAYIVGEDGYFKPMNIEETPKVRKPKGAGLYAYGDRDFRLSSYVPSLVQLRAKGSNQIFN